MEGMKNERRKAGTGENEKKRTIKQTKKQTSKQINKLLVHLYACKEWFSYGF